jgi:uncharacterized membrane protein YdfJ with MMPL/SSD domain
VDNARHRAAVHRTGSTITSASITMVGTCTATMPSSLPELAQFAFAVVIGMLLDTSKCDAKRSARMS